MTRYFASHEHIFVKSLADVFVDSLSYNAHTTAADTLWGGLPHVTCPEEKMSARVGASLLTALGGHATIARNADDMARIVTALAGRRDRHWELRRGLWEARETEALFDTIRGVRNLEVALRLAVEAEGTRFRGRRFHVVSCEAGGTPRRDEALEGRLRGLRVDTAELEARSGALGL